MKAHLLLLTVLVLGCIGASGKPADAINIRIVVTKDFGRQPIVDIDATVEKGTRGIKALELSTPIAVDYDAGYLQSINKIPQTRQSAWFSYVDGHLMDANTASHRPKDGELITWDYHEYAYNPFIPSILVEPSRFFKCGQVFIVHDAGFKRYAQQLAALIPNANISETEIRRDCTIYIIAPSHAKVAELASKHREYGVFAYTDANLLLLLDKYGEPVRSERQYAIILPLRETWIITATNEVYLQKLITTLKDPKAYENSFGFLVTWQTEKLPINPPAIPEPLPSSQLSQNESQNQTQRGEHLLPGNSTGSS